LNGTVVVDESMLTGESRPVRKFPLKKLAGSVYKGLSSKHTLYAGTSVLQTEPESGEACPSGTRRFQATAVVTSTGANTFKGEMIRSILYLQPIQFTFDMEMRIVFLLLFSWAAVASFLIFLLTGSSGGGWFYAMCSFVMVVSPLLPAMLLIGQTIGARRLAAKDINCLQVRRVLLAGKVSVACFDKTGTLTKQGLQFNDAQAIHSSKHTGLPSFSRSHREVSKLPHLIQVALASAHSVTMLEGKAVGNPVDLEMFTASKWRIVPSSSTETDNASNESSSVTVESPDGKRAQILRVMAFEHRLMRMLVVVRDVSSGIVHVFCKGSFETIRDLSDPDSLPDRFDHRRLQGMPLRVCQGLKGNRR
jgi:cation-transporting ATPase 13A3/4/5